MTWFDHDTGSVWSQPQGEAILGPLTGERLELLPSTLSTWGDWRETFPDTLALDTQTVGVDFRLSELSVVASVGEETIAIEWDQLQDFGQYATELGGEPILLIAEPGTDRWAGYSRLVDGEERDLVLEAGVIVDPETGNRWDPSLGAPLDGQGEPLDRVSVFSSFDSDYLVHFPDGELIDLELQRRLSDEG